VAIRRSVSWIRIILSLAIIAGISAIFHHVFGVNATTAGFAYLVGILAIASVWGIVEALLASAAAMLGFTYFFLPPIGRFATIARPI
jgi:two-component system sensor histidine kinase KdpD